MSVATTTTGNDAAALMGGLMTAVGLNHAGGSTGALPPTTTPTNTHTNSKKTSLDNHESSTTAGVDDANTIHSIRNDLTYLTHHIYRLVLALQVPPCTCGVCNERHVTQSNLILSLAQDQHSTTTTISNNNMNTIIDQQSSNNNNNNINNHTATSQQTGQEQQKSNHSLLHIHQQFLPNNGHSGGESETGSGGRHTPTTTAADAGKNNNNNNNHHMHLNNNNNNAANGGLTPGAIIHNGSHNGGHGPSTQQSVPANDKDYDTDLSSDDTPSTPKAEPVDMADCFGGLLGGGLGNVGGGGGLNAALLNGMTMETLAAGLAAFGNNGGIGVGGAGLGGMGGVNQDNKQLQAALLAAASTGLFGNGNGNGSSNLLLNGLTNPVNNNNNNNNNGGLPPLTSPLHQSTQQHLQRKLLSKNSLGNGANATLSTAAAPFSASTGGGVGSGNVGRKSKYCTAEEKAAVAAYALSHGASAAARKFNIPPAVAAYYHRKIYNKGLPKGRRPTGEGALIIDEGPISSLGLMGSGGRKSTESPSMVLDPYHQHHAAATMVPSSNNHNNNNGTRGSSLGPPPSATFPADSSDDGGGTTPLAMTYEAQKMCQSINTTGNNGLGARVGTGKRGRPKLIGDDVDAELLTYLVNLRRSNPETKISAENILRICSEFIRQRRPGLLIEDGGNVQLRQTWAVKMLMRMNEWERLLPVNGNMDDNNETVGGDVGSSSVGEGGGGSDENENENGDRQMDQEEDVVGAGGEGDGDGMLMDGNTQIVIPTSPTPTKNENEQQRSATVVDNGTASSLFSATNKAGGIPA